MAEPGEDPHRYAAEHNKRLISPLTLRAPERSGAHPIIPVRDPRWAHGPPWIVQPATAPDFPMLCYPFSHALIIRLIDNIPVVLHAIFC